MDSYFVFVFVFETNTRCFTTLGHNCRRCLPRSLWWKKFV